MNLLMKPPHSVIKETNRLCCKAVFLICITVFFSIYNYAEAQEPIDLYFILEKPTQDKKFDRAIATFIEQNLRDVENKPKIESHCMTEQDYRFRKCSTFLECVKKEKKPYALTVNLIPHRDEKTISIEFILIDINNIPSRSYIFKDVLENDLSDRDREKIKVHLKKILSTISGRPYKIIFTYCFDYSGNNEEILNIKTYMPRFLTAELKQILKEKNLEKVYEVMAIPVDCNKRQDTERYLRENYYYSISGTLTPKPDGSLKDLLNIFKQRDPVPDIPPFEYAGEGGVYKKLANFIIDKLPSITRGGQ